MPSEPPKLLPAPDRTRRFEFVTGRWNGTAPGRNLHQWQTTTRTRRRKHGLLQGVGCTNPIRTGQCAGAGVADPNTAFRIGSDGMSAPLASATPTLSQPYTPGLGSNPETVDPDALDPHFKPDRTDNFTVTIQREINQHINLELGYIGKIIKNEYMLVNLDAVPYMTTLGGQSFAQAYSQMYQQIVFNGLNPLNVTAQ